MASPSSPMKEVEEKFFKCSLCLQNFKDPKQLPCLHRYCRDCLQKLIDKDNKMTLNCPLCKSTCEKPAEGADGFKTDFFVKSLLEYIQVQTSFEEDDTRVCAFCSKKQKADGYCFKCNDFLCEPCYQIHLTSKMFTEHQQHLLSLTNVEAKNMTLQKLASLSDEPRCHDHPQFIAQLCCTTCTNLPVCVTCTYSKHKSHDLQDVSEVAKVERKKLQSKIDELNIHKAKLYELKQSIIRASETLKANVIKKTDKLIAQHMCQFQKIKRKLKENDVALDQTKANIIEATQKECEQVQKEFDNKIEKLRAECNDVIEGKEKLRKKQLEEAQEEHEDIQADLIRKQGALDGNLTFFQKIIDTVSLQNEEAIREIANRSEHTINRFENFNATTSTILSANHDWTDVRYLPDIRSASGPLIRDAKQDLPGLAPLSDFTVRDLPLVFDAKVTLIEREEAVIDIFGMRENKWEVLNMASSGDDRLVVTGSVSDDYSFICVINMRGKVLRQDIIEEVPGSAWYPHRYCAPYSKNRTVTLCRSGEIGIYDLNNGKHTKKDINDITSSWPIGNAVSCITADPINKTIYVGSRSHNSSGISRDVLVFNGKLQYCHTLRLPDIIRGAEDIALHEGGLLVCDYYGKKAHAISIDGKKAAHAYELTKPDHDGYDWYPVRSCKDSNDYIYMRWEAKVAGGAAQILTQYNQGGFALLRTIPVVCCFSGLCTVPTNNGEKLMLAALQSGKMFMYGLVS